MFRRARAGLSTVNDRRKTSPARGRSPGVDPGRFGSWRTALDCASMKDHSSAAGRPIFQIIPPHNLPVGRICRATDWSVARRPCRAPNGQGSSHLATKHLHFYDHNEQNRLKYRHRRFKPEGGSTVNYLVPHNCANYGIVASRVGFRAARFYRSRPVSLRFCSSARSVILVQSMQ